MSTRVLPPGKLILIADDDDDSVEFLKILLTQRGHEVRTARDGAQAIEAVALFQPDVAILDISMPVMDGYEAARRIRDGAQGQRIVLIALTGWDGDGERVRCQQAGFDHRLVEPLDPTVMERLIMSR